MNRPNVAAGCPRPSRGIASSKPAAGHKAFDTYHCVTAALVQVRKR